MIAADRLSSGPLRSIHLESRRILPHLERAIHCGEMILL
jgi:hypothetical protein